MKKNPFTVGQRVKCVEENPPQLKKGKFYTVSKLEGTDFVSLQGVSGGSWYASRFVAVKTTTLLEDITLAKTFLNKSFFYKGEKHLCSAYSIVIPSDKDKHINRRIKALANQIGYCVCLIDAFGKYYPVSEISPQITSVKLNKTYTAEIQKDGSIKVGCQKFPFKTIENLYSAAKEKNDEVRQSSSK